MNPEEFLKWLRMTRAKSTVREYKRLCIGWQPKTLEECHSHLDAAERNIRFVSGGVWGGVVKLAGGVRVWGFWAGDLGRIFGEFCSGGWG